MTVLAGFELPPALEASEPPEARGVPRDAVRMMVSRRRTGEITHHPFTDLPGLLLPGDLLVVNTSATLPAAVRCGPGLVMHFSTSLPDGSWLAELRAVRGHATQPFPGGSPGQALPLPGGAVATLAGRVTGRLWRVRLSTAVVPYLLRHGSFIHYSYVAADWPAEAYQTVFAATPGSAEMPSASRPFTAQMLARLVVRGVTIAPLTLHTGVSSLEGDEEPYPEPYDIPPATARLVDATRRAGGRVVAVGTTVVRALESSLRDGQVQPFAGETQIFIFPGYRIASADALITNFHLPESTLLMLVSAFAGRELMLDAYRHAVAERYRFFSYGDAMLILPKGANE